MEDAKDLHALRDDVGALARDGLFFPCGKEPSWLAEGVRAVSRWRFY